VGNLRLARSLVSSARALDNGEKIPSVETAGGSPIADAGPLGRRPRNVYAGGTMLRGFVGTAILLAVDAALRLSRRERFSFWLEPLNEPSIRLFRSMPWKALRLARASPLSY
jgi:hypothetical protein